MIVCTHQKGLLMGLKEVMKNVKKLFIIFLLIFGIIISASECIYANEVVKINNNKRFELPSKIHKDGEGFYEIGRMLTPRYRHSSVLLQDGRVFIVGGQDKDNHILNTTEIFDPKTGKSIKGPVMPYAAFRCTLKLLSNGNVLIVGGKYNSENRVSVYLPTKNKIIEVDNRLGHEIIRVAVIEEVANEEVFIADYFNPLRYYSFYNKNTNEVLNVKEEQPSGKFFDAYLGRVHNNLYFLWGPNVIIINVLNRNNFINTYKKYKFNLKPRYFGTSHSIFLKDNKTLFIYTNNNDSYILFNTQTKTSQEIKPNIKLSSVGNISLLENGNILFFSAYKESINIVELDPHKGFGIVKPYTSPNLTCASVVKLDDNNLLYIGGTKVHHDGLISFGYYYGASDKIYLWKTKKENN